MDTAVDNDELARFREAWKAEVRSKTAAVTSPTRTKEEGNSSEAPPEPGSPLLESKSAAPAESEATMAPVDLYRRAVHAEEEGRLDEALRLYRKAFRRDPRVDKAFHREEVARAAALPPASPMEKHPTGVDKADSALAGAISTLSLAPYPTGAAELDALLAEFPPNLMFSPQDDRYSSPLEAMPLEILLQVLLQLAYNQDILAIERFAGVCRKARSVSLDPAIWRFIVQSIYISPQIPRTTLLDDLALLYGSNYRTFYKEHPRIRLDGVYIAVCHYVRAGLSENVWISVSHLITYHRYLRFFPSGAVLSLLANEDAKPQELVHQLRPGLRMKGFMQGRWWLDGTTVYVTELLDPHAPSSKYSFKMVLRLKSRPTGRWNKLDLDDYLSVSQDTGEEVPFPLTHERPFWFSKVRSY